MRVLTEQDRDAAIAAVTAAIASLPPPTGTTVPWHGRQQLLDAMPDDGDRGACRFPECGRELCYCRRCVYPETMTQAVSGPLCHACWADVLGWGTRRRRLHHCSTCTCVEGEGWG